jgi:xanthine dehydrogenase large subunit
MKHLDAPAHTRGEPAFVDDLPEPRGLLHAAVFASPVSHGTVLSLDTTTSRTYPGVVGVFTAADISGANQIGGMVQDEPLLADVEVHFVGQPVAVVVAESPHEARVAATAIEAAFERLPPVFDPREAAAAGHFTCPRAPWSAAMWKRPGRAAPRSSKGAPSPAARNTCTS